MLGRIVSPIPSAKRGKGRHQDYMPKLQVGDINSRGESRRTFGWKARRDMHTFSSHETNFLYCCDWSPIIMDIREQFPLSLSATVAICQELGIAHPSIGGKLVQFTTDFVLTIQKGDREVEVARSIKPARELENDSVLELAEVEDRVHQSVGRDWGFVTDRDIPLVLAANIKRIHGRYFLEQMRPLSQDTIDNVRPYLLRAFARESCPMYQITDRCDKRFALEAGNSLTIVDHLIANRLLPVNMMVPIDPGTPLILLPPHLRRIQ